VLKAAVRRPGAHPKHAVGDAARDERDNAGSARARRSTRVGGGNEPSHRNRIVEGSSSGLERDGDHVVITPRVTPALDAPIQIDFRRRSQRFVREMAG
jgi:hypothetical protein